MPGYFDETGAEVPEYYEAIDVKLENGVLMMGGLPVPVGTPIRLQGYKAGGGGDPSKVAERVIRLVGPSPCDSPGAPVNVYEVGDGVGGGLGAPLCQDEFLGRGFAEACSAAQPDFAVTKGLAFLVPGRFDLETGAYLSTGPDEHRLMISCFSGFVGRCLRWGYVPWTDFNGVALKPYFEACVHGAGAMVRANSGRSFTEPLTRFKIYDRLGLQKYEQKYPYELESVWGGGPAGAKCWIRARRETCLMSLDETPCSDWNSPSSSPTPREDELIWIQSIPAWNLEEPPCSGRPDWIPPPSWAR